MCGAAVAAAAAALGFAGVLEARSADAQRWRERAFEAEARLAELRDDLARAQAERSEPVAAPVPQQTASAAPLDTRPAAGSGAVGREPQLDAVWGAVVGEALRSEVQRRAGRELSREQEARLLERLREVRSAGLAVDAGPVEDESARRRRRLSRAIVLLEADRAFREELGIGMSEFLSGLDAGAVEPVGPAGAPAEAPAGG